uniref:Uncharacterized protein LOC117359614 n=1 Tax=Geotrypetes seraphini TaxID=260995 RepID=A0A6P8RBH5_GEOSA|nr:uncharacterized protein LOC117359614 [Geotrypetes seraphini]
MPHIKRKGTVRTGPLPSGTSTPMRQTLLDFPARSPSEIGVWRAVASPSRDLVGTPEPEVSLSPPDLSTPPCPAMETSGLEGTPDTLEVAGVLLHEGSAAGLDTAVENKQLGFEVFASTPSEVSLVDVWRLLQKMDGTIRKSTEETTNLVGTVNSLVKTVDDIKKDMDQKFLQVNEDIPSLTAVNETLIKDKLMIHKKIEQLENYNRRLNLKLLNFPKTLNISPVEMFRNFLTQNLNFTPEMFPPLNKIYYLPTSSKKKGVEENVTEPHNQAQMDLGNISEILESPLVHIEERATLLVSFVFQQDLNATMKTYFRNAQNPFMGQRVWIYPDVNKETQERRKLFLNMRQEVKYLGANYQLAYPCKCLIKYLGVKYTFFVPDHLRSFLDLKKINKG